MRIKKKKSEIIDPLSFDSSSAMINSIDNIQILLANMKKEEELRQRAKYLHEQHYKISTSKTGSVMTWVFDPSKENNRRKIKKTTMDALLDELVSIYIKEGEAEDYVEEHHDIIDAHSQAQKEDTKHKTITFREFYSEWLSYQGLDHDGATIVRYDVDWNKYYVNEPLSKDIIDNPIKDIKPIQIKVWAYKLIEKYKMTSTKYYNVSTILRQGLAFAASEDIGIIDTSPFKVIIKKSDKKFKHAKKPENKTQVFNLAVLKKLIDLCWEDYNDKDKQYLTPHAILFMIETGVRIGELLGLFWNDVEADTVNIKRQYGRIYDNGVLAGYDLKEYTKSEAGERSIPLTNEAIKILQEIRKYYLRKGIITERIFEKVGYSATRNKLYRYCDKMNEIRKSNHKIRKTYVSRLLYNGLSINDVRELAGHNSEQTTLRNYTFGVETDEELKTHVKEALAL